MRSELTEDPKAFLRAMAEDGGPVDPFLARPPRAVDPIPDLCECEECLTHGPRKDQAVSLSIGEAEDAGSTRGRRS